MTAIAKAGHLSIPSQLIELRLIDEYHFVVQPIVAGEGRGVLEGISLQEKLQLKLVESKIFKIRVCCASRLENSDRKICDAMDQPAALLNSHPGQKRA